MTGNAAWEGGGVYLRRGRLPAHVAHVRGARERHLAVVIGHQKIVLGLFAAVCFFVHEPGNLRVKIGGKAREPVLFIGVVKRLAESDCETK